MNTNVTQTDGALFNREFRKWTAEEQMDQNIDDLSWYAVINNHKCRNFIIFDEVRICIKCGNAKSTIDNKHRYRKWQFIIL